MKGMGLVGEVFDSKCSRGLYYLTIGIRSIDIEEEN
jgi:hypothetical protein